MDYVIRALHRPQYEVMEMKCYNRGITNSRRLLYMSNMCRISERERRFEDVLTTFAILHDQLRQLASYRFTAAELSVGRDCVMSGANLCGRELYEIATGT